MAHMAKEDIVKMQISRLEKELRDTPHHKATDHHIGRMRAKLSMLKDKLLDSGGKKGGGAGGYAVRKQGDGTVVLVGPPSAGKSTLLNKLTNAQSKVAPYAFTTVSVIPGMMTHKNAMIQILDVPGLIEGAEAGKGRGREVLSVVRGADLLVIMSDINRPEAIARIAESLESNGIRINKEKPQVKIEKKVSGGISVHSNIKQDFNEETIKEIAREMGIKNAEIAITEKLTMEKLIDSFSKNRVYVPAIFVINKADEFNNDHSESSQRHSRTSQRHSGLDPESEKPEILNQVQDDTRGYLPISAEHDINLDELRDEIWTYLGFTRIYLVRADEDPNHNNPLIISKDSTLLDVAKTIGTEFAQEKKKAKIWGPGAKFPAQEVSLSTKVEEGMQIRFI